MSLQAANYSHFTNNSIYRATTGHLVDLAGSADGRVVIDLGCGTGACGSYLLQRYKLAELILVDPDKNAARERPRVVPNPLAGLLCICGTIA